MLGEEAKHLYPLLLRALPPLPPQAGKQPQKNAFQSLRDGLGFVASHPLLRALLLIDLAALILATPLALMPEWGDTILKMGATATGYLYAAPAVANDHYNHLADYLLKLPAGQRPTTVAYAAMDDPFAQGTAYGLRDKLKAGGLSIVVDEVYPPNTTDFSSIAAQIASTDADIMVGGTQYQDAVNLILAMEAP